jgi:subtilisin family serine protease
MRSHLCRALVLGALLGPLVPLPSRAADAPDGAAVVRLLGDRAEKALAPGSGRIGALVAIPPGASAAALGLDEVAPGIGRLRTGAAALSAWAAAHPDLRLEVAPPLRLNDYLLVEDVWARKGTARYGVDGKGTLVGVVDTGLDVAHPSFLDENGKSRVAWMLDLSMKPLGLHPDLEAKFGVKNDAGVLTSGAVLTGDDIDTLLAMGGTVPVDTVGHGTHVAGIAAANPMKEHAGVAPGARLVIARVTRGAADGIETDDMLRGAAFVYDRADREKLPIVANFSLGSEFGPHDGSMLWEKVLASYVGPDKPGHVLVAAAGNSGSISGRPTHQSVRVSKSATTRVPFTIPVESDGTVQVWVTKRAGADLRIGLDGPTGTAVAPIADGIDRGKKVGSANVGVIHGSAPKGSLVPKGSAGAIVVLTGTFTKGTWSVTFEGQGMAELYLVGLGGLANGVGFDAGVRDGTVNLPATHPQLLAVGCTVNRTFWKPIEGRTVGPSVPLLDPVGGMPDPNGGRRDPQPGEVCFFSSAGPNALGVPKPEIAAPGGAVFSSMSHQAKPGVPTSIFSAGCPQGEPKCLQIDDDTAVSSGTSMAAPAVSGVVAMLLERNPSLTQDVVRALLQAGAHPFRGAAPFMDQSGPGEVDALGSLEALDELADPKGLPSATTSWMTLSADYVTADGSTPITGVLELRTEDARKRASLFETSRLHARVRVSGGGPVYDADVVRAGPGLFTFQTTLPAGLGGRSATFEATFDGVPVVAPRTVPIGADTWSAGYPTKAGGGACALAPPGEAGAGAGALALLGALLLGRRRRRA